MPRGQKQRYIAEQPQVTLFKPAGVRTSGLARVVLSVDELEAIRLADFEGLYHDSAAERMGISRPTFGRLVAAARQKVADAIVNGKALVIQGGTVAIGEMHSFVCAACGHTFACSPAAHPATTCTNCGSPVIERFDAGSHCGRRRRGCQPRQREIERDMDAAEIRVPGLEGRRGARRCRRGRRRGVRPGRGNANS